MNCAMSPGGLVVLMALSAHTAFAQSGWVREKGDYFVQGSLTSLESDRYYDAAGMQQRTDESFQSATFQLYAEYGLAGRLTGILHFPILRNNRLTSIGRVSGIGDVRVEIKYGVLKRPLALAVSAAPEFPTGPKHRFVIRPASDVTQLDQKLNLATGDGELNVWTTAAVSYSFYPLPFYLSAYASHNLRSRGFPDQTKWGIEGGYCEQNMFCVILRLTALSPVSSRDLTQTMIDRGDGSAYTSPSIVLLFPVLDSIGLSFAYTWYSDWPVKRKNLYSAPSITTGIFLKRSNR